MFILTPMAAQ